MNRIPTVLLAMAVLAPMIMDAGAETMAERKQRIMRKYLRENQYLVQSDLVVPDVEADERITDSEKFSQRDELLTRQPSSAPPPAPLYRPIPVPVQEDWLLAADPDADPFADPFALKGEERSGEGKADWYAEWKRRNEERAAAEQAVQAQNYEYLRERRSGPEGRSGYSSGSGLIDPSRSIYGNASGTIYERGQIRTDPDPFGTTRYGSPVSAGSRQWSTPSAGSGDRTPASPSGYTPYRSPYQMEREQRQQQQQPGYPQTQQQEEFRRTTPYQKWKNNNQGWDPTADDAYLNELMRRNR